MDKRSKILLVAFTGLVALTAVWKFYVYFIAKDYLITSTTDCDPYSESCFSYICEEGEECEEYYYKKITMSAQDFPSCDPYEDESCEPLSCALGQEECEVFTCSDEYLDEWEECITLTPEPIENIESEEGTVTEEGAVSTSTEEVGSETSVTEE